MGWGDHCRDAGEAEQSCDTEVVAGMTAIANVGMAAKSARL